MRAAPPSSTLDPPARAGKARSIPGAGGSPALPLAGVWHRPRRRLRRHHRVARVRGRGDPRPSRGEIGGGVGEPHLVPARGALRHAPRRGQTADAGAAQPGVGVLETSEQRREEQRPLACARTGLARAARWRSSKPLARAHPRGDRVAHEWKSYQLGGASLRARRGRLPDAGADEPRGPSRGELRVEAGGPGPQRSRRGRD